MVLDADARRARAVARLARWTDRAGRRLHCGHALWEHRGLGWLARNRYAAAQRHVERVAGRDVAAGRLDVDPVVHVLPARLSKQRADHYLAAAAAYNRAAVRAATDLVDAAAERADDDAINRLRAAYADDGPADLDDAAAAEGVRRAPGRAEVPDHDHDDRRW